MLRYALLAVALVVANGIPAVAQEVGRYQILTVPLGIEGEGGGTTVLLDTQTGRTWHVMLDDKGRPRWRGIDSAGGSQALAEAADQRRSDAPGQGEPDAQEGPRAQQEPQPEQQQQN